MSSTPPSKDQPPSTPPGINDLLAVLTSNDPKQIQATARAFFDAKYGIRPAWMDAKETAADLKDASPMLGVGNFSQYTQGATYYWLSDPTEVEQIIMARKTAWGKRLTWGLADDAWNNKFKLKFYKSDGKLLSDKDTEQKNADLDKHLRQVKYYGAMRKADAYDGELGESLVFIHRQGEDLSPGSAYLASPANPQIPIIRYEAISKADYVIDYVEGYGQPHTYRITFRGQGGKLPTYTVHPSHCTRVRVEDYDYDQYKGQSRLKANFTDITVLVLISKGGADLINRIGAGKPVLSVPNVRSKADLDKVKLMVGNIAQQEWIIKPVEVTLELLSASTDMASLMTVADFYLNNICTASQIPRTILMGENLGVYGGEVPQAEYYNVLDKHHGCIEEFCREALEKDPWFVTFIQDLTYEFAWGLRHVMSQAEEIDYRTKTLTVMGEAHGIGFSNNEIRALGKFPTFEEAYKDLEDDKFEEIFFGINKKQMANLPGKFFNTLMDIAAQTYLMAAQAQMGGTDLEEDPTGEKAGSAGGKAKPPLPSKGQANPHEVQGNSMPKDQRPKVALPEGELRREKVSDAEFLEEMQDIIALSISRVDEIPGMRSKLITKMPVSNGTMYKVFDWATERAKKLREAKPDA